MDLSYVFLQSWRNLYYVLKFVHDLKKVCDRVSSGTHFLKRVLIYCNVLEVKLSVRLVQDSRRRAVLSCLTHLQMMWKSFEARSLSSFENAKTVFQKLDFKHILKVFAPQIVRLLHDDWHHKLAQLQDVRALLGACCHTFLYDTYQHRTVVFTFLQRVIITVNYLFGYC